jgi:small neutral amino acid transporter SnatA (MarC family)
MPSVLKSALLLYTLLNPFILSVYLHDLMMGMEGRLFARVMLRAALIAGTIFCLFAAAGDAIFSDVLGVRFASFQIFGGIVFAVIGMRYVFHGPEALKELRGPPEHIAGAVAMPVMVGPGTVTAAVLLGTRHSLEVALAAVIATVALVVVSMVALKKLFDVVKVRNEPLVARYTDVVGRVCAFVIGTIAVEMVLQGIDAWRS